MTRQMRLFVWGMAVAALAGGLAYAAANTPLTATFLPNDSVTGFGLSDDGNAVYANGVGGVKCYLGAGQKDVDLVTYNTSRTLRFAFDPSSPAFQASGLTSSNFLAQVDLYGVNYFGPFPSMGVGTTAQVQMDIQFYSGGTTYALAYQSVATKRLTTDTWLLTTDPNDIGGYPGFTASDQAALSVVRRRSQQTFGAVNMPIRFEVKLQ